MAGSSLAHCATTHVPISICLSVFLSLLPSFLFLSFFIKVCLFEMQSYRKRGNNRQEKEEETFHLPVHYSKATTARVEPG